MRAIRSGENFKTVMVEDFNSADERLEACRIAASIAVDGQVEVSSTEPPVISFVPVQGISPLIMFAGRR